MIFRRARGGGPDVILVDTAWFPADFLAYQLASRGVRVHAFTPSLRWPPYLRAAYPYRSYVEEPIGDQKSDSFAAMVERVSRPSSSRAPSMRCTGCGISPSISRNDACPA